MKNSNTPATNVATVKTTNAPKGKATTKAKANANVTTVDPIEVAVQMPATTKVAKTIVRVTTDEKVANLKASIVGFFGITDEKLTSYTNNRLAKSGRKTNLVDFYTKLIVELVTKPEVLVKLQ